MTQTVRSTSYFSQQFIVAPASQVAANVPGEWLICFRVTRSRPAPYFTLDSSPITFGLYSGFILRMKFGGFTLINPSAESATINLIWGGGIEPVLPSRADQTGTLVSFPDVTCGAGVATQIIAPNAFYNSYLVSTPAAAGAVRLGDGFVSASRGLLLAGGVVQKIDAASSDIYVFNASGASVSLSMAGQE